MGLCCGAGSRTMRWRGQDGRGYMAARAVDHVAEARAGRLCDGTGKLQAFLHNAISDLTNLYFFAIIK